MKISRFALIFAAVASAIAAYAQPTPTQYVRSSVAGNVLQAPIVGSTTAPIYNAPVVSIAALRTLNVTTPALASGVSVQVQGYYAANDGGGGVYVWNAASTATDNGGSVIAPTGIATGRWIIQSLGPINVRQFGAKGDGVSDDTTAITAAFAQLTSNKALIIPFGNYLIGPSLSVSISSLSNVLIISQGATFTLSGDTATGVSLFAFSGCSDLVISGLGFNGNAYIGNPFFFSNCTRLSFINNTIQNLWRTSSTVDGVAAYFSACQDVKVKGNTLSRCNKAIVFDDDGSISKNVVIVGNVIEQDGHAAIVTAHWNCSVTGNVIRYASLGPFTNRSDMRNPAWTPSPVTGSYGGGKGCGISTGSNTYASGSYPSNVEIVGNTLDYIAEYGIGCESGFSVGTTQLAGPAINLNISGNTISNCGTQGIFVCGIQGLTIVGNNIRTTGLSGAGDAAIVATTRGLDASFSGQPLANKQQNGIQGAVIDSNVIIDRSGTTQLAFYTDTANVEAAIQGISFSHNTINLSNASKTWGFQIDNSGGTTTHLTGIRLVGNYFYADAVSASATPFISGQKLYNSCYMGNRQINFGGPNNLRNTFFQYPDGPNTNFVEDDNQIYPFAVTPGAGLSTQTIGGGAGSPQGVVTADIGSLWLRTDGSTGTTLYIKETGLGTNTGWVAK